MRNLRVLHIGFGPHVGYLSRAERKLGLKSDVLLYVEPKEPPFGSEYDFKVDIPTSFIGKLKFSVRLFFWFWFHCFRYDIFHFYGGFRASRFLQIIFGGSGVKIFQKLGKKFVFHFIGDDGRLYHRFKNYKFSYAEELGIDNRAEEQKEKIINWFSSFGDLLLVFCYELLEYVPGAVVSPLPYDKDFTSSLKPSFSTGNRIKIVHAPSNRIKKGTAFILPAVEKLKQEFKGKYEIDFQLVEGTKRHEALKIYANADVCIDQLRVGTYGTFSIESMALGKPVLCYIRDDIAKKYRSLPIVNTNPENIYENLKLLIENRDLREKLGKEGKAYVKRRHDPAVIAKKLVERYRSLF